MVKSIKITELLKKETIILDLQAQSKQEVLSELAGQLNQAGQLNNKEAFIDAILAREKQSTTGVGEGIAIPHAKSDAVKTPAKAFGRSSEGLDSGSLEGRPASRFVSN